MLVHYVHEGPDNEHPTLFLWQTEPHDADMDPDIKNPPPLVEEQQKFIVNTFFDEPILEINSGLGSFVKAIASVAVAFCPISGRSGQRRTWRTGADKHLLPGGALYVPSTGRIPGTSVFRTAYANGSLKSATPQIICYGDPDSTCTTCKHARQLTELLSNAANNNVEILLRSASSVTISFYDRVKALFTAVQDDNLRSAIALIRGTDGPEMIAILGKQLPPPARPNPDTIKHAETLLNLYRGSKDRRRMSV